MGNQAGKDKKNNAVFNEKISNAFQSILKCPTQVDLNNRLNTLLNLHHDHTDWVGSLSSQEIRQFYNDSSDNLEFILQFTIDSIFEVASKKQDVPAANVNIINNCLRLITKIIPILYENTQRADRFLWQVENLNYSTRNMVNQHNTMKIYRSNDEEIDKKLENRMSQGIKLIISLQNLCFQPAFTILPSAEIARIPKDSGMGQQVDNSKLWSNPIVKPSLLSNGPQQHPNSTMQYDESRHLVISAILACCSSTLFVPCYGKNYLNPWLAFLTSPMNAENGLFFLNLLFYIISYRARVVNRANQRASKSIALIGSQIIYAILCHQPPVNIVSDLVAINTGLQQMTEYFTSMLDEGDEPVELPSLLSNGILNFLQTLQQPEQFSVEVVGNLLRLLEDPLEVENSLFVNSLKEIEFSEEHFGILQQLMYFCPLVSNYICSNKTLLHRMFKVIMYQFCKSLDYNHANNTYYICLSLLTIMSNNPIFNEMLNERKDFNINLRHFPIIDGTLADLLISSCAQAIINSKFHNTLCHPFNLMSILKNIAPYVKGLSRATCEKMNQLVIIFTDMHFLTQSEFSPMCIVKLLEVYDHLLSRHLSENIPLVFELFLRSEIFNRIPKINFREPTLRAYFKSLQINQVDEESSQQPENMKENKVTGSQQNGDGTDKEGDNKKIPSDQKLDTLDKSKSSQNSQKKRPKRAVKGKKGGNNNVAIPAINVESKSLQKQNQKERKSTIYSSESDEEESKEDTPIAGQGTVRVHRSPEDAFVEKWKHFDWLKVFTSIPLANLAHVLKQTTDFVGGSMKKTRNEVKYDMFEREKNFLGNLKLQMKIYQPILSEHFSNDEDILTFAQQCCWMQVLVKQKYFPAFDPSVILYFRTDLQPIQLQTKKKEVNVDVYNSTVFTESKHKN